MSSTNVQAEFMTLLSRLFEDGLTPSQFERMTQIMESDAAARVAYREYVTVHAMLHWRWHGTASDEPSENARSGGERKTDSSCIGRPGAVRPPVSSVLQPPLVAPGSTGFPAASLPATVGFFSSGWPVAYLAATVILGLGLLIGAITHVSRPEQLVQRDLPLCPAPSSLPSVVGQITGMVDCQFAAD
jgi:hypothetical protein